PARAPEPRAALSRAVDVAPLAHATDAARLQHRARVAAAEDARGDEHARAAIAHALKTLALPALAARVPLLARDGRAQLFDGLFARARGAVEHFARVAVERDRAFHLVERLARVEVFVPRVECRVVAIDRFADAARVPLRERDPEI